MLESDQAVRDWLRALAAHGVPAQRRLELLDHLACAVEERIAAGLPEDHAILDALPSIGPPADLGAEFSKNLTPERVLMKLLSTFLLFAFITWIAGRGPGGLVPLLDLPNILFVCVVVCGGLFASFGPTGTIAAIRTLLEPNAPWTAEAREQTSRIARRGVRLSWAAGVIGALLA